MPLAVAGPPRHPEAVGQEEDALKLAGVLEIAVDRPVEDLAMPKQSALGRGPAGSADVDALEDVAVQDWRKGEGARLHGLLDARLDHPIDRLGWRRFDQGHRIRGGGDVRAPIGDHDLDLVRRRGSDRHGEPELGQVLRPAERAEPVDPSIRHGVEDVDPAARGVGVGAAGRQVRRGGEVLRGEVLPVGHGQPEPREAVAAFGANEGERRSRQRLGLGRVEDDRAAIGSGVEDDRTIRPGRAQDDRAGAGPLRHQPAPGAQHHVRPQATGCRRAGYAALRGGVLHGDPGHAADQQQRAAPGVAQRLVHLVALAERGERQHRVDAAVLERGAFLERHDLARLRCAQHAVGQLELHRVRQHRLARRRIFEPGRHRARQAQGQFPGAAVGLGQGEPVALLAADLVLGQAVAGQPVFHRGIGRVLEQLQVVRGRGGADRSAGLLARQRV